MSLTRIRWLTAVCLALGITPLCQSQEVWRPVARSVPPAVIASTITRPASAGSALVTLGKPIAIASSGGSPPTPNPVPVVVRAAYSGGTIIRGQSPDLDSGSPYPPPVPPTTSGTLTPPPGAVVAQGPYTSQEVGRFNAPVLSGVAIPQVEMAPAPTSGDPVVATPASVAPLPPPPPVYIPTVTLGLPRSQETRTVSATVPASGPVDPPPPSASDLGTAPPQPSGSYSPYSTTSNQPDSVPPPGAVPPPADITPGVATDRAVAPGFWENCRNIFTLGDQGHSNGRCAFQSDHAFDAISSPVSMPFYAEDPRSLTEVRPIFIYQRIPTNAAGFGGGNVTFFGTQARLALTERFSIVMSELGYLSLDPKAAVDPVQKGSGFSEIKIGPKYTFLRSCNSGSLGAFGVNFDLPVGSDKNYQNGAVSIDPYFSFAQTFGRLPSGFGSLNFMSTTGYSFSADKSRSQFFYSQMHLDYNVANANKFFPLIELNWLRYTSYGNRADFGTEGGDLINLGSTTRRGENYFSAATGLRYRFSENIQAGAAIEVPLSRERGLSDYRLTFDVIFRY